MIFTSANSREKAHDPSKLWRFAMPRMFTLPLGRGAAGGVAAAADAAATAAVAAVGGVGGSLSYEERLLLPPPPPPLQHPAAW